jgi:hypothetical protein
MSAEIGLTMSTPRLSRQNPVIRSNQSCFGQINHVRADLIASKIQKTLLPQRRSDFLAGLTQTTLGTVAALQQLPVSSSPISLPVRSSSKSFGSVRSSMFSSFRQIGTLSIDIVS